MVEGKLLEDLRQRKPEAVAQAVRLYAGDLLRAALGLGWRSGEAEELVQASFTSFLEALPRFEGRSTVKTFLFGILYRKSLEQGRKKARELATDPADEVFETRFGPSGHWSAPPKGPDEEAATGEMAALIGQCLEGLPDQQRAAFLLKEVERLESQEVCNILGVQDTHLRVLLFRARARLRECIEAKWA